MTADQVIMALVYPYPLGNLAASGAFKMGVEAALEGREREVIYGGKATLEAYEAGFKEGLKARAKY